MIIDGSKCQSGLLLSRHREVVIIDGDGNLQFVVIRFSE